MKLSYIHLFYNFIFKIKIVNRQREGERERERVRELLKRRKSLSGGNRKQHNRANVKSSFSSFINKSERCKETESAFLHCASITS